MDLTQELFSMLKKHLELKDSYGNNPYMPKEKFEALYHELQKHVVKAFEAGQRYGSLMTLAKVKIAHDDYFNDIRRSAGVAEHELREITTTKMAQEELDAVEDQ